MKYVVFLLWPFANYIIAHAHVRRNTRLSLPLRLGEPPSGYKAIEHVYMHYIYVSEGERKIQLSHTFPPSFKLTTTYLPSPCWPASATHTDSPSRAWGDKRREVMMHPSFLPSPTPLFPPPFPLLSSLILLSPLHSLPSSLPSPLFSHSLLSSLLPSLSSLL